MPRVWLDTDIGTDIDDAVAVLCAARHPDINLLGVSTVWGRVEIRAWLAREMLQRAQHPDIPVLPGAMLPLSGDQPTEDIPPYGRLAPDLHAAAPAYDEGRINAIADAMMALPQPFHLVPVGPLTNIAHLLERHPDVTSKWEGVTCMAGSLEEWEYNVRCDTAAAQLILDRLGPRLVGGEACSDTLTREEAEAALDPSDPASAFLLDCYRLYREHPGWHDDPETAPLTLFDPIALLSLVESRAFNFQPVRVLVENDGRMRLTDDGASVLYALSSNWDTLKPLIAGLLRGSASSGTAS